MNTILKRMKAVVAATCFTLLTGLAMSGSVAASTPDGITPANEGVCDSLMDATKGLYGLCVAYCEAQDLDSVDKKPPSLKILENYNKKKQAGDPDMPCLSPSYGCFNQAELESINTTNHCMRFSDNDGSIIQFGVQDGLNSHFVKVDTRTPSCVYVDFVTADAGSGIVRNQFNIDQTQADTAYEAVEFRCSSLGL